MIYAGLLSWKEKFVKSFGLIAIALIVPRVGDEAINVLASTGVVVTFAPLIKIMAFNLVLIYWDQGMASLIEITPNPRYKKPLRILGAAVSVAWIAQGIVNAPDFLLEMWRMLH